MVGKKSHGVTLATTPLMPSSKKVGKAEVIPGRLPLEKVFNALQTPNTKAVVSIRGGRVVFVRTASEQLLLQLNTLSGIALVEGECTGFSPQFWRHINAAYAPNMLKVPCEVKQVSTGERTWCLEFSYVQPKEYGWRTGRVREVRSYRI